VVNNFVEDSAGLPRRMPARLWEQIVIRPADPIDRALNRERVNNR